MEILPDGFVCWILRSNNMKKRFSRSYIMKKTANNHCE